MKLINTFSVLFSVSLIVFNVIDMTVFNVIDYSECNMIAQWLL